MKAILMSIKPKYVSMILNKIKTIEVRKRFPSDYVGWVYIYCTKEINNHNILVKHAVDGVYRVGNCYGTDDGKEHNEALNGKVVARVWCDNVGVIKLYYCFTVPTIAYTTFADKYYSDSDLQVASCLNGNELMTYLGTDKKEVGFAIHISQLEIFDTPKELNEFATTKQQLVYIGQIQPILQNIPLTKAPQSRQYIEVEE